MTSDTIVASTEIGSERETTRALLEIGDEVGSHEMRHLQGVEFEQESKNV